MPFHNQKHIILLLIHFVFYHSFSQVDTINYKVSSGTKKNDSINNLFDKIKWSDTLYLYIEKEKYLCLTFKDLKKQLNRLNDSLFDKGFIYNKIYPEKITIVNNRIHLYYNIKTGNKVLLDSIVFSNYNFPRNYSKNLLKKFKNQPLTHLLINEIKQNILRNNQFLVKENAQILIDKEKHYLSIGIDKKKTNSISGVLGFNYNNELQKPELEGEFKTGLFNIFKHAEDISFVWRKNKLNQNLLVNFKIPYLLSSDFSLQNSFFINREDSTSYTISNKTFLGWHYKKNSININYTSELIKEKYLTHNNFIGFSYLHSLKQHNTNYIKSIGVHLSIKNDKKKNLIFNTNIHYFFYKKNWYFKQDWYYLQNFTNSRFSLNQFEEHFFRKNNIVETEIKKLINLKNEVVFKHNEYQFYGIYDFIYKEVIDNPSVNYINLGLGIKILNKNQKLTVEVIKPLFLTHLINYQSIYINIKQNIVF